MPILKTGEIQREGEVYAKLILIGLLFLTTSFQDEAYKGGEGDGFATAELQRFTTNIKMQENQSALEVFPNPVQRGQEVFIQYDGTGVFQLISSKGAIIELGAEISSFQTRELTAGVYILQMRSQGKMSVAQKIIVL